MNETATRPAGTHTRPRSTARIFRTAFAITLGVLTALIMTATLFMLLFAGASDTASESEGVVGEVVYDVVDEIVEPDPARR